MKSIKYTEYEYKYYWIKFKGRIVIAEYRIVPKEKYRFFHIPGEILCVLESDVEVLQPVEDYNAEV
jgi:hypothetical protein